LSILFFLTFLSFFLLPFLLILFSHSLFLFTYPASIPTGFLPTSDPPLLDLPLPPAISPSDNFLARCDLLHGAHHQSRPP
jgi:hypothetical protein